MVELFRCAVVSWRLVACSSAGNDNPVAPTPTTVVGVDHGPVERDILYRRYGPIRSARDIERRHDASRSRSDVGIRCPGRRDRLGDGARHSRRSRGGDDIRRRQPPRNNAVSRLPRLQWDVEWHGTLASCEDSGSFETFCAQFPPIGTTQDLGGVTFTQTEASVVGVLFDLPPVGGTVTIGGELQFDSTSFPPSFITFARFTVRTPVSCQTAASLWRGGQCSTQGLSRAEEK